MGFNRITQSWGLIEINKVIRKIQRLRREGKMSKQDAAFFVEWLKRN